VDRDGHPNVTVEDHSELGDRMFDQGFVGTMSLGIEVVNGTLRIQSMGNGIRQDLILVSSDGAQTTWQQVCTRHHDAVEVELVRLDPASERGKGRGALAYRNFLLWCDLAGVEQVALEAGKDVGAISGHAVVSFLMKCPGKLCAWTGNVKPNGRRKMNFWLCWRRYLRLGRSGWLPSLVQTTQNHCFTMPDGVVY
jgi:hypothetical protein